ncbi:MAG TPA: AraC family transcriptional regulator, partial [Dongiaceae bacterium]
TPAIDMANSPSLISNDGVSLGTVFDGRWSAGQLGRTADLGPGDAVFMSNSDLGNISLLEQSRFVTFGLPRSAVESLGLDLGMLVARRIPATNPALRMLLHYLELAREETIAADLELRAVFSDHVCDLLSIVLGATGDAAELAARRGIPAARLHAIKEDVRKGSDRADLSVDVIAARHGVSARYVQRVFETAGTTFTQYLTEQRLARVYKALRRPAARALSISTIAYDCGFADISHFNRLFRRRFGCTPSDARNSASGRGPGFGVLDA